MSAAENVHYIGQSTENNDSKEEPVEPATNESYDKTSRDMGKVALFVAILSVVLLVVFFFGLNQNLKGVSARVDGVAAINSDLTSRMVNVEDKIVALEKLPHKSKMMVMGTMLQDMAQRAAYLGSQMDTEGQSEKLQRAMELLQQVQTEITPE